MGRVRLGLLSIDSLDQHLWPLGGNYPWRFTRLFGATGAEVILFDGQGGGLGGGLPDPATCDGWIIPGSRLSVYDDLDWIRRLQSWTVSTIEGGHPVIGICFGHQLIAQALGGRVAKADVGWNIGAIDYEVTTQPPALAPLPASFRLLASHQDQVLELPAEAEPFATTPTCPVGGYTVGDTVVCVQGHPEFDAGLVSVLYDGRRERIGDEAVDAAIATLDRPLDNDSVATWLTSIVPAPTPT